MGNETSTLKQQPAHMNLSPNHHGKKGKKKSHNSKKNATHLPSNDKRSKRRQSFNGRTSTTSEQSSTLGLDLNSGKTLSYIIPQQNQNLLQLPSSTKSSSNQSKRRRSFSSASASSSSTQSSKSSNTKTSNSNKRAMLVSSGDVLEPPLLSQEMKSQSSSVSSSSSSPSSSSSHSYQARQVEILKTKVNKGTVVSQVDFVNMNHHTYNSSNFKKPSSDHLMSVSFDENDDDENNKNNRGGRKILRNVFKKKQKKGKQCGTLLNGNNGSSQYGVIDMTNAAVGSSGFIHPIDYKNLNGMNQGDDILNEDEYEDDDDVDGECRDHYYHPVGKNNNLNRSVLPYDRFQQEYNLHDNGRLPTILDVSYQSSTMNVSVDHDDVNPVNVTSLLDDHDNHHWEEEDDNGNENDDHQLDTTRQEEEYNKENELYESDLKEDCDTCHTPVNSVVTEEAYDLKSRFSSCTKSKAPNVSTEKNMLKTVDEVNDNLDIDESNYTANLNSFLDKVHASYDAEGEQIGDIQTPMVRLGDLFGDITLNNSKYQSLDSSHDEDEIGDKEVDNSQYDSRLQALEVLQEALDEDEESPAHLLEELTNQFGMSVDEANIDRSDDAVLDSRHDISKQSNDCEEERSNDYVNVSFDENDVQKVMDFINDLQTDQEKDEEASEIYESNEHIESDGNLKLNETERKNSPMPQLGQITKAPTSPTVSNLLPKKIDETEACPTVLDEIEESEANINEEETNIAKLAAPDKSENIEVIGGDKDRNSYRSDDIKDISMPSQDVPLEKGNNYEVVSKQDVKDPMDVRNKGESRNQNKRGPQIGTIINVTVLKQEESFGREKRPVTYCDTSTLADSVISTGKKDAFTKEAMFNANFLFAGGPNCIYHSVDLETKIDRERLTLMHTKEVNQTTNTYQTKKFDALQLINNAKLELEECKKRQLRDGHQNQQKMSAVQIENKVEVKLSKSDHTPRVEVSTQESVQEKSKKLSEPKNSQSIEKKETAESQQNKIQMDSMISESYRSPNKMIEQNNSNQMYDSPPTRDSLDEILEGISPSELKNRYSAITPMKSFSPFVRFKKAMRMFEHEGRKSDQEKAITTQVRVSQKMGIPVRNKDIFDIEAKEKSSKETPPRKNISVDKSDFANHQRRKSEVEKLDNLPKAPHTLKLVKTLLAKPSISSAVDEVEPVIDEARREVDEERNDINIANNTDDITTFARHDTHLLENPDEQDGIEVSQKDSNGNLRKESYDLIQKESNSYSDESSKSSSDDDEHRTTSTDGDSPYDEADELSISATPQKSLDSSLSNFQSSVDSLNTSPMSTESEDVFAALLKNATADSPDVSASSPSSASSSSSFSLIDKPEKDVLKSALKSRRTSDSMSPQHLHSVRWSLADFQKDEDSVSHTKEVQTVAVDKTIQSNQPNEESVPISIYDESVCSNSSNHNEQETQSHLQNDSRVKVQRAVIFSPGEESSRVSITPPPLSQSFRAAVNPRAQQIQRMNTKTSTEKENHFQSSNIAQSSPNVANGGDILCTYSPLEMSNEKAKGNNYSPTNIVKPQSPSALCLSPLQRTPLQARKWRTLAAQAEEKKKSTKKIKRKSANGLGRTPLGKLKNRRNMMTSEG